MLVYELRALTQCLCRERACTASLRAWLPEYVEELKSLNSGPKFSFMEDRQLALVGAPRGADSALSEVSKSEALLELRRAAALSHHHRQIWVKDPHGGMYRKVSR